MTPLTSRGSPPAGFGLGFSFDSVRLLSGGHCGWVFLLEEERGGVASFGLQGPRRRSGLTLCVSCRRCRQFVEMVNGTDSEVRCFGVLSPKYQESHPGSPNLSPLHGGAAGAQLHSGGTFFFSLSLSLSLSSVPPLCPVFTLPPSLCPLFLPSSTPVPSGPDSPTCSNGVTPPSKPKGGGKHPGVPSSASSSSSSSSPSSVNYSESNSSDSTKSQPHSAHSPQETR